MKTQVVIESFFLTALQAPQSSFFRENLTITGPNNSQDPFLTIDGNRTSRIFMLDQDTVNLTLFYLVLSGGYAGFSGGAIYGGDVTLHDVTVKDNEIMNSLSGFTYIQCSGAGISAHRISVYNSTVSNNIANDCSGGGLFASAFRLQRSTISGNSARTSGGIHVSGSNSEVFMSSTTITNNSSIHGAGGLGIDGIIDPLTIKISNSILSGNQGPQGNYFFNPVNNLISTLAVNHSIFGDDSTEINGTNQSNILTNQPDLGPLKDNGGPTETHLPNQTSPALDKGDSRVANYFDQRGPDFKGIVNHRIDIGSVEYQVVQDVSTTEQAFNENLAKWQQFGLDSYEVNVKIINQYSAAENLPIRHHIQNNIVVNGYYDCSGLENPGSNPKCGQSINGLRLTIDSLFKSIQTSLDNNDHRNIFFIAYDSVYGYPTLLFRDRLGTADGRQTLELSQLRPLESTALSSEQIPLIINHRWQPGLADPDPINSVFFYTAPSTQGSDRGVVRMRKHAGKAELRFQEWSNLDGWHTGETIDLIKLMKGRWTFNTTEIEINTAAISGLTFINHREIWGTIHFSKPFIQPPLVFLALQTSNGSEAVSVRVRDITNTSMRVVLMEEDLKRSTGHVQEIVGYLLVSGLDEPLNTGGGVTITQPLMNNPIRLNHLWQTIAPGKQLRLEEDQTIDAEVAHLNELVHLLNINGLYLSQIASYIGRDNAVLRSRNTIN